MNLDRVFELLSAEADDELTREERAELDTLIGSSDEARQLATELRRMENFLESRPAIEPPAGLRDAIMQRIPLNQARVDGHGGTGSTGWLRGLGWQPLLKHAASAAFGALLVIAVYESQPDFGPHADITQLVGTMAPGTVIADKVVLDRFAFDDAGVSSTARLEKRGTAIVLDISIDADSAVDLLIDFGATSLQFEAVAQTDAEFDAMQFANRVLRVNGRGARRFAVLLRSANSTATANEESIRLEYTSNGELLRAGSLKSSVK